MATGVKIRGGVAPWPAWRRKGDAPSERKTFVDGKVLMAGFDRQTRSSTFFQFKNRRL